MEDKNNKVILLKQNSRQIRDEIGRNGIGVCPCAEFVDSKWLDFYPSISHVHGVGYAAEGMTAEETLAQVEYEWKQYGTEVIECKNVHEFIKKVKEIL